MFLQVLGSLFQKLSACAKVLIYSSFEPNLAISALLEGKLGLFTAFRGDTWCTAVENPQEIAKLRHQKAENQNLV